MKKIEAIIKPFKLDDVRRKSWPKSALPAWPSAKSKASAAKKGHTEIYRGAEYAVDFLPKVKIELVLADDKVDQAVDAILETAHSGKIGDGKIFIYPVEEAIRIRTGERSDAAL